MYRIIGDLICRAILLALVACTIAGVGVGMWPTETRWGVNFVYQTQQLSLFEKTLDFASREFQTKRLVRRILEDVEGDSLRASVLFDWTVEHVAAVPDGMPIVDDHVFHILIRGYGAPDQQAEAYALLADFAGLPSRSGLVDLDGTGFLFTLVQIGRSWHPFDVPNKVAFRTREGELAALPTLLADTSLVVIAARRAGMDPSLYLQAVRGIERLDPSTRRMDAQRLWRRPIIEIRSRLGNGND